MGAVVQPRRKEVELRDLLHGEFSHVPESELVTLVFVQHYAEQADRYDAAARRRLQDTYGIEAATDILTRIRLITFANLYGNTFDVLLELPFPLKPACWVIQCGERFCPHLTQKGHSRTLFAYAPPLSILLNKPKSRLLTTDC